jgi:hypothetical protein
VDQLDKKATLADQLEIERRKLNSLVEEAMKNDEPLNSNKILQQDKKLKKILEELMKNDF